MSKIVVDYQFGDSVLVVFRTVVQQQIELEDGSVEVVTDDGTFHSEDTNLVGVFPDPED